ncbi:MAG TPA: acetolactate synthase large subunit [Caulobacteraceae bacterium]|jgi:acetolactate synthase-1/2/3 large subunit|nr:acetolactate synthase large subunit [Caulobacteraceae bacterium]
MNGADALIETLIDNDVVACFANPGTSEMQFVSALDRQPKMRPVLCLFEGVATGAADGYGRIAGKPACTLLHLGPGYGNGLANLHNARRAFTPIVNVIGDHATYHRHYDAPLNSAIAAIAGANSVWVKSAETPDEVSALAAEAISASFGPPGGSASLILPADCAWLATNATGAKATRAARAAPASATIDDAARRIKAAAKPVILLGTNACSEAAIAAAGRVAATGVRVLTDCFIGRQPRGAGRFAPDRMMYFGEAALADLAGVDLMLLVETTQPVAFFAYPDKPSVLVPEGCETFPLASRLEDGAAALEALADALGAPKQGAVQAFKLPEAAPTGALTAGSVAQAIARHLPEGAIVSDDSVTSGQPIINATRTGHPHDWLGLTGGAIGQGIPVAVGAAVAAPGRKVVSLNGDGAAMYTQQGLWTLAREGLDVTVVIFANHVYRILGIELGRTGAGNPGPAASKLLGLGEPTIDWVSLAKALGVPATRCETAEAFEAAFARAMAEPGPKLIEAVIP